MTNGLTSPRATGRPPDPAPDAARGAPPPSDAFAGMLDAHQARTAVAEGQSPENRAPADDCARATPAPADAAPDTATTATDPAAAVAAAVLAALPVPAAPVPETGAVVPTVQVETSPVAPAVLAPVTQAVEQNAAVAAAPAAEPPAQAQVAQQAAPAQPKLVAQPASAPAPGQPAAVAGATRQPAEQQQPQSQQQAPAPAPQQPAPAAPAAPAAPVAPAGAPAAAARPALATPTATPVPLPSAAEAVEHVLHVVASRGGATHARIALHPAELGAVDVHIRSTAEGLVARVVAHTAEAVQTLQHAANDLRQSLEEQGLTLMSLDIGQPGDRNAGRAGSEAGDQAAGADSPIPGEADDTTTQTSTLRLPSGVLVDVLA